MRKIENIFPFVYNKKDEDKIRERQRKIQDIETFDSNIKSEYSDVVNQNDLDKLVCLYNETILAKGKLEDKAKSMTLALTVSVTLILGLADTLSQIFGMVSLYSIRALFSFLGIMAIGYMIFAGLFSAKIFLTDILVYKINETEEDLKQQYMKCTILNRLSNTVRSNYIYTSYECLRNSLSILFFIFVFVVIVA